MSSFNQFKKFAAVLLVFLLATAHQGFAQDSDVIIATDSEAGGETTRAESEIVTEDLRDEFEQWRDENRGRSGSSAGESSGWGSYSYRNGSRIEYEWESSSSVGVEERGFGADSAEGEASLYSPGSGATDSWILDVDAMSARTSEFLRNRPTRSTSIIGDFDAFRSSAGEMEVNLSPDSFARSFDPFDFSDPVRSSESSSVNLPEPRSSVNLPEPHSSQTSETPSLPWGSQRSQPSTNESRPFDVRENEQSSPLRIRAPAYLVD